jgi:hypothetical protein
LLPASPQKSTRLTWQNKVEANVGHTCSPAPSTQNDHTVMMIPVTEPLLSENVQSGASACRPPYHSQKQTNTTHINTFLHQVLNTPRPGHSGKFCQPRPLPTKALKLVHRSLHGQHTPHNTKHPSQANTCTKQQRYDSMVTTLSHQLSSCCCYRCLLHVCNPAAAAVAYTC